MNNALILVADDEHTIRESLAKVIGDAGFNVVTAADGRQALRLLEKTNVNVALLDIRMPSINGLEVLTRARSISPGTRFIILTAFGSVENAVEAIKLGANDYVTKPFIFDDVLMKIDRLLSILASSGEVTAPAALPGEDHLRRIVGSSQAMANMLSLVRKVAETRSNALITGESGTGKELVARAIHFTGLTRGGRFMAINCAALPESLVESELFGHSRGAFTGAGRDKMGLFELAGNGTLFFDEICSMPLPIQPKILRAIEERQVMPLGASKPVDIQARVLGAANCDLGREVREGRFRRDLYYRLNIIEINIPPLRDRREDIPDLANHFVALFSREMEKPCPGVSAEAMNAMMEHSWPGNVRELKNVIERAIILGDGRALERRDLAFAAEGAAAPHAAVDLKSAMRASERHHLLR